MYSQKTKNGRVQFFEGYKDPITGRSKTASVVLDKETNVTRKAAKTFLDEKIRTICSAPAPTDLTLQQLIDKYTDPEIRTVRSSTLRRDERYCKVLAEILDPNSQVNRFTARYILDCFAKTDRKKSPERIVRLKALLRWGYMNEYIRDISYLDRVQMPAEKKPDLKEKYLEADELKAVLDALKIPEWKDAAEFLSLTGLRIGEAQSLLVSDVDKDVIHVTKTFDREALTDGPTKTDDSTRDVFILPQLRPVLKRIHPRGEFLLSSPGNDRLNYDSFRQYFGDVTQKTIGRRLSPHALRHTYTSLMAAAGVPLDVISRQLGHSDSRITKAVYLHITEKLKERDRLILGKVKL